MHPSISALLLSALARIFFSFLLLRLLLLSHSVFTLSSTFRRIIPGSSQQQQCIPMHTQTHTESISSAWWWWWWWLYSWVVFGWNAADRQSWIWLDSLSLFYRRPLPSFWRCRLPVCSREWMIAFAFFFFSFSLALLYCCDYWCTVIYSFRENKFCWRQQHQQQHLQSLGWILNQVSFWFSSSSF